MLHSFDDDEPAPFPAPVIIFAILLGLNLLAIAYQIKVYVSFMNSSTWAAMTHPQFSGILYTPALEPLLYLELLVNCASLAGMLALLILLARKSWSFLKWVRVYLVGGVIYQLLQVVALICLRASLPGKDVGAPFNMLFNMTFWGAYSVAAFIAIAVELLWLAYFSQSERVRKTFIN